MPTVNYGHYAVSDQRIRAVLENIAREVGQSVRLTSGDRNVRPKGSPKSSLHLINEAVDFHIEGISDETAFMLIRMKRKEIFCDEKGDAFRYQIIRHGSHTATQAAHIHLSYSPADGEVRYCGFLIEGITPATKGQYSQVELP